MRKTIGVFSFFDGCGASFLSAGIAFYLKERCKNADVWLAELASPYFARALDFDSRGVCDAYKGIRCCFKKNSDEMQLSELFHLIYALQGDYAVYDCGGLSFGMVSQIIREFDVAFLAADPMPVKLISNYEHISAVTALRGDASVIINKMNPGVHRASLRDFWNKREVFEVPMVDPSLIYRCEYARMLPFENKAVAETVFSALDRLNIL